MTGLMFVHGTGVRRKAYDKTTAELRKGLAHIAPDTKVHECYWGDVFGVHEGQGRTTVPGAAKTVRTAAKPTAATAGTTVGKPSEETSADLPPDDEAANIWGVLYDAPLTPLRPPAPDDQADIARALYERPRPGFADQARALAAEPPADLAALLDVAGARAEFTDAMTAVLDSSAGQEALTHGLPAGELPTAVATAVVAHLLSGAIRDGSPPPWSPAQRDEAVRLLTQALGGGTVRGVLGGTWTVLAHLGGMRYLMWKRASMTDKAHPKAGDILKYLARGDGLRTHIRQTVTDVAAQHGPVVLVAHSLGGVAAVDLLARHELPGVRHLVTVGSQAAHLHELGALPCLDPGKPLPEHFPSWTNVYDRRDLLAFLAEPVFPGRARDIERTSGQPFPASHSAYFSNPDLHTLLAGILREGEA
ncbi:alpha/beta hydrolase [Streptomyces sp. NL15-2K]|uniref:alpha/beta hydrolase n=1 Tax=Streptomyces sp. NL15-2K TaxID=376149 RepID=UPI000FFA4211|nr:MULTISPECIES: alpha/beta hydrolase [Actinomycetes]WKX09833.1 alpha/beta hydrolase [Kutzneria buriramensis]GCB48628.1 hypothetical protein SNL152K_5954 [Streptomyces sp. NL15-2K]